MNETTISKTMARLMKSVVIMNDQCYAIFNEHGGYNYNDAMLTQLQGLRQSIGECLNEEDWKHMEIEATTTFKWFKHIEQIRVLEESEPESLYC